MLQLSPPVYSALCTNSKNLCFDEGMGSPALLVLKAHQQSALKSFIRSCEFQRTPRKVGSVNVSVEKVHRRTKSVQSKCRKTVVL